MNLNNNSFQSAIILLIGLILTNWIAVINSTPLKTSKLSKHPVVLVVSFDGFRFDYMTKVEMPTFKAIQNEGVSVPYMLAQFPSKTFPNHHSISTGLYPNFHGVIDNNMYDPLNQTAISGKKDDPGFWNYNEDVIPFWIRNEQAGNDRYSGCFMWAGSSQGYGKFRKHFPTHYIKKYDSSVEWNSRVKTVISWMTHENKPANVVFLYHNEPDSSGHANGPDDQKTLDEIRKVDDRLAYLVKELGDAGIYDKINLIVLSDHGMQTTRKENIINTLEIVNPQLYNRYGSSPVFHIQPKNSSDINLIYNEFKFASEGKNFSVFRKGEMSHLKFGNNRRIMDIVLLADPGFAFEDIHVNSNGIYGVHGYDPKSINMTTIFMARGHLFKKGLRSPEPIENVDLFSLFSKLSGVPVAPNNGSFERVSNFLTGCSMNLQANAGLAFLALVVIYKNIVHT